MKRVRPVQDDVTLEPLADPHVLTMCGHTYDMQTMERLRQSSGAIKCPTCRAVSCWTVPNYKLRDVLPEQCSVPPLTPSPIAGVLSIRDAIARSRHRRREIFHRCMTALGRVLVIDIEKLHYTGSLHPTINANPQIMYAYRHLVKLGVFREPADATVCISYCEAMYCDYFLDDGIRITIQLARMSKAGGTMQCPASPTLFLDEKADGDREVRISLEFLNGYDADPPSR